MKKSFSKFVNWNLDHSLKVTGLICLGLLAAIVSTFTKIGAVGPEGLLPEAIAIIVFVFWLLILWGALIGSDGFSNDLVTREHKVTTIVLSALLAIIAGGVAVVNWTNASYHLTEGVAVVGLVCVFFVIFNVLVVCIALIILWIALYLKVVEYQGE